MLASHQSSKRILLKILTLLQNEAYPKFDKACDCLGSENVRNRQQDLIDLLYIRYKHHRKGAEKVTGYGKSL